MDPSVKELLENLREDSPKKPVKLKFDLTRILNNALGGGSRTKELEEMGLPDLLFIRDDGESDEDYHKRQDEALKTFVQDRLKIRKRGDWRNITLIDTQLEFITDFFFERIKKGICWKSRGTGGSLCGAIIAWLCMVYHRKSLTDIAGSAQQAEQLYDYTKDFWDTIPETKRLLRGDPSATKTNLVDGTFFKCLANSQTAARSKHPEGLIADEMCQEDPQKDKNLGDALQMPLSEENSMIIMLSTFHSAGGLFEEYWDNAEKRGFKKYYWSIFECMEKCTAEIDCDDCPLTKEEVVTDAEGRVVEYAKRGCAGKARNSKGWMKREQVLSALDTNEGSDRFWNEWACERPQTRGPVYAPKKVESAFKVFDKNNLPEGDQVVGIDWGWEAETAIIGPIRLCLPYAFILEEKYFTTTGTDEIENYLEELKEKYGDFEIWPDSSHPFNNSELHQSGWTVMPVVFKKWKGYGIGNVSKWLWREKLKIHPSLQYLKFCLLKFHKDANGKPAKTKLDHGPDSLMSGLLRFVYPDPSDEIEDGVKVATY